MFYPPAIHKKYSFCILTLDNSELLQRWVSTNPLQLEKDEKKKKTNNIMVFFIVIAVI